MQLRIDDPLLVTTEANVFYLTGFESSNAALLVERDRTRLFTDFRYAESARHVPDVEFAQVKRNVYAALAEMLEGRVAFEAAGITYDRWETLRGGGLELVPTRGVVEALRAVGDEARTIYDACLEAQQAALDAARAGKSGQEVDAIARDRIAAAGFGDEFGHGLGHGVGILVHEAPVLRPESADTLEPGNVVTVEPGIYLPGRNGVRIEDLVVVTDGDPEVPTSFTKELVTVG